MRFLGDVGYVVTFRQTDPLFTIDLSDPTDPLVRGELKIPGYSAYLHPVSDTLVLGVGQDATDTGGILGSQVSLFDVSDLDNPERIAKLTLGRDSNSTAEYDHKAFLLWDDTIVLPITEYGWREGKDNFHTGAVAIAIGDGELTEIARLAHPRGNDAEWGWNSQILRSLVIGDSLYTVSSEGVLESDWVSFDDLAWLGDYQVTAGAHNHCAAPPMPAPDEYAELTRISVQPADGSIDSCLMWSTVDFFVTSDGRVAAITHDFWEP